MNKKQKLRELVWKMLEQRKIAKFPGAFGRIPNFEEASKAGKNLFKLEIWKKANFIKSNPDSPQRIIREKALLEGKTVYMAVPKLKELKCFIKLEPDKIKDKRFASTIKGAFILGKLVHPEEIEKIDLIVVGSVALNIDGKRLGKGGGYSDLEYAIGRYFGFVKENTPIVTTVHEIQIIDEEIPLLPHDIPVDYIITQERVIKTGEKLKKPDRILKEYLTEEKIESIPILKEILKS
ncbi:MAG: 5-formyltetrahydrofolate cyclo-ligase [candidate division WOR-3 bacterium]